MTAALSADSKTLAAVTMGQENGVFASYEVFYRVNSEKRGRTMHPAGQRGL